MNEPSEGIAGPVDERERIRELDVLRGVALFGVLLSNLVGFAGAGVLATSAQLGALSTASVDGAAHFGVLWLVGDKANTMFATLFGLGFYLQMKRGEGRPGFELRYARRLTWLLVFGWLNATLLWIWDILNLYALAGFFLLAMRRWRTRTLLIFGILAALYSDKAQQWIDGSIGLFADTSPLFSESAALARQHVVLGGDYPSIVATFWQWTWGEWFMGGLIVAWLVYALGRFALGACIGRSGILEDVKGHLPLLRRIAWLALPAGLAAALVVRLLGEGLWDPFGNPDFSSNLGEALRSPAALLLAAGYSAAIVVLLHRKWGSRLFGIFAPVGQMALTNYLVQGFLYGFVMFGIGPGLGLAGRIGTSLVIAICVAFFAFQILFSRWWLARFRFGPMEWLWRSLTYGERPAFRRDRTVAPAPA
ncbi:DUF418 domain-containing protein [Allosphingosinicella sp.]|jgi:uncharacterized protein|uniref:DUF418 domain-containing protein n=1 Tax=Allosphingosinicella sp. TaxID=2823234 RepID=UPI002EFC5959